MILEGTVKHIIFENDSNGFRIFSFDTGREDVTVKGTCFKIVPGDNLSIDCSKIIDPKYGEQYFINHVEKSNTISTYHIENFLASGAIKGIGEKKAKSIVEKFGKDTLDIIQNNPVRLLEVSGIGKNNYADIKKSLDEQKENAASLIYLESLGLSLRQATLIIDTYKEEAIAKVKKNPYQLIDDIRGIGFKTADMISQRIDIEPTSPFRIKAGIKYYMDMQATSHGNSYVEYNKMKADVSDLLAIDSEVIEEKLESLLVENVISIDDFEGEKRVYTPRLMQAEKRVAYNLSQIIQSETDYNFDVEKEMRRLEKSEINFDDLQKDAIRMAMTEKVLIITGGPGTGKTSIVKEIVEIYKDKGKKFILAAPTGRAAKRLQESCSYEAKTIHRLLGYIPLSDNKAVFEHDEDDPIETDLIIVDEASMMDIFITDSLLRAISPETRIIFVGDVDQLPSVQAGNVLKDMINSEKITTIKLEKIFRQADDSNIIINAHRINKGLFPILNENGKGFYFQEVNEAKRARDVILELCAKRLPDFYKLDPIEDITVLTPMKKSFCGTVELNRSLQEVLNPKRPELYEIESGENIYRMGDKVMQTKNDYTKEFINSSGMGVFNGDMGRIVDVEPIEEYLEVQFDEDKICRYFKKDLYQLSLAYAITIHKSQGSEFPVVVIPISQMPYMLMTRNLIYTAVTRAKGLVMLVGSRNILAKMIENNRIDKRNSSLDVRIREYSEMSVDEDELAMMDEIFEDENFI
ncbi:MAG: ATP-dependent RecD-like DNA helicase [Finegoldia sp.]|nr:ATP-dependent RecD-like DNA helicase [Finegoldia sp.]